MGQPKLSLEAHKQGWRKAKEHTSSDPRNPDFSHYISASYDDIHQRGPLMVLLKFGVKLHKN